MSAEEPATPAEQVAASPPPSHVVPPSGVPPWGGPAAPVPPVHRPAWPVAVAVVVAMAFVGGLLFAGWAVTRPGPAGAIPPRPEAPGFVDDVVSRASACAGKIFSYDYRTYDAGVSDGLSCTTGAFRKEYRATTARLADTAKSEKAVVRTVVSQIGVIRATSERVEVLAFVNQHKRNDDISGEQVDENRVTLVLVPVKGMWLVSDAEAI